MKENNFHLFIKLILRLLMCAVLVIISVTIIAHFQHPLRTYEKVSVDPFKDKKVVIFGDSVSYGAMGHNIVSKHNYLPLTAKYLKAKSITNYSVPGSGVMVNSQPGYTWQNLIYVIEHHPKQIKNMDVVILAIGRNDSQVPGLTKEVLSKSFMDCITSLKKINKNIRIFGILPWDGMSSTDLNVSDYHLKTSDNNCLTLSQVSNTLADVYKKTGIYFFDPRTSTEEWTKIHRSQFGDQRTHPTDLTFRKMTGTMINWFTFEDKVQLSRSISIKKDSYLYPSSYDALIQNKSGGYYINEQKKFYASYNVQYNGKFIVTVYKNKQDFVNGVNSAYVYAKDTNAMNYNNK